LSMNVCCLLNGSCRLKVFPTNRYNPVDGRRGATG